MSTGISYQVSIMSTAGVLRAARALLERQGWCQGVYRNMNGSYCAAGALRAVCDDFSTNNSAAVLILRSVPGALLLSDWNDAPERTRDEILEAFSKAIAFAEALS